MAAAATVAGTSTRAGVLGRRLQQRPRSLRSGEVTRREDAGAPAARVRGLSGGHHVPLQHEFGFDLRDNMRFRARRGSNELNTRSSTRSTRSHRRRGPAHISGRDGRRPLLQIDRYHQLTVRHLVEASCRRSRSKKTATTSREKSKGRNRAGSASCERQQRRQSLRRTHRRPPHIQHRWRPRALRKASTTSSRTGGDHRRRVRAHDAPGAVVGRPAQGRRAKEAVRIERGTRRLATSPSRILPDVQEARGDDGHGSRGEEFAKITSSTSRAPTNQPSSGSTTPKSCTRPAGKFNARGRHHPHDGSAPRGHGLVEIESNLNAQNRGPSRGSQAKYHDGGGDRATAGRGPGHHRHQHGGQRTGILLGETQIPVKDTPQRGLRPRMAPAEAGGPRFAEGADHQRSTTGRRYGGLHIVGTERHE